MGDLNKYRIKPHPDLQHTYADFMKLPVVVVFVYGEQTQGHSSFEDVVKKELEEVGGIFVGEVTVTGVPTNDTLFYYNISRPS